MSGGYTLCDHTQVPDLVPQLTRLSNLAFGEYEGGMAVGESWTAWYLQRPGTDLTLCQAALHGDAMVSNVLVCVQTVRVGGELLRCGIIDSVATDPDHRRHGLARALMDRAHEAMAEGGLEAAVLYTNPEDHPYRFYGRLGYQTRARAAMLAGPRPEAADRAAESVDAAKHGSGLRALLDHYYSGYEGYTPLDEALWRWHKLEPPEVTPTVVAELTGSGPIATATFAPAELLLAGERRRVSVAYDVAAQVMNADQMASLLSAAPEEWVMVILDDAAPERGMADQVGLEPQVAEVSMVLPLSARAERALDARHGPWYAMVESLIGV